MICKIIFKDGRIKVIEYSAEGWPNLVRQSVAVWRPKGEPEEAGMFADIAWKSLSQNVRDQHIVVFYLKDVLAVVDDEN